LSFGALVAMMIASSGDESFIMLAMIPQKAMILFAVLFVLAIVAGIIVDRIYDRKHAQHCHKHEHDDCGIETDCEGFELHDHACEHDAVVSLADAQATSSITSEACTSTVISSKAKGRVEKSRHFGWKRICMFIGLAIFIAALATGRLGHDHSAHAGHDHSEHVVHEHSDVAEEMHTGHVHSGTCCHEGHGHSEHAGHDHSALTGEMHAAHTYSEACCHEDHGHAHSHDGFNLLSEDWMNVLFAGLSVIVLFVLLFASDHFVNEHLWKHIIRKHLPTIFAWTFGVLLVLGIALQYIDIKHWTSTNTALMILLATLVGIIPESGPHLIFLTLYASGAVSFPVLLASSISQDGHASIPLLAESKKSFVWAKLINCAVALLAGFTAMLFM
jgi:hypothetical protein